MNTEFLSALAALEKEKGIDKHVLIDAIENALVSAYKKNYGAAQDVRVQVDPDSGAFRVFAKKTVVEEVTDDTIEISVEDAHKVNVAYEPGRRARNRGNARHFRAYCGADSQAGCRAPAQRSRARRNI